MAKVEACGGVMGGGWHMALDLPIDFGGKFTASTHSSATRL